MTILQSRLKELNNSGPTNCLQAVLLYPKVVILENKQFIRIVDISGKNEDKEDGIHSFDCEIGHYILHNHFLWIVLESGELRVIDPLTNMALEIKINNYANYKINQFVTTGSNLFLISEGGERLNAPFSAKELVEHFFNESTELIVTLEKAPKQCKDVYSNFQKFANGLDICIESTNIVVKCPITGLCDVIPTISKLEHVVLWNEKAVLAGNSCMWIINLCDFNTCYEFENTEANYYPLAAENNIFYYLLWNKETVFFCSATPTLNENNSYSNQSPTSTAKLASQHSLKLELKSLKDKIVAVPKLDEQVLPILQSLFIDIDDNLFLIDMATILCNHNLSFKSLLYPLQKKIFTIDDDNLRRKINDVMIKIDLLEYILFRGNNNYNNVDLMEQNVIDLCVTFISKSDLDLASICWVKYTEIKLSVNSDDVIKILDAVPYNIKMGALIVWLRNFLPYLVDENPFHIDLFVKWTTDRVFLYEQSSYWPKIGLKFIEDIISVVETSSKTICIRPISIDGLDVLKDHIYYIMELKEKYKINMLLNELSSQSPTEVALIMLRRCYTEDLDAFLQNSLQRYSSRHLFDLDDTLRSFIESEAASSGGGIDGLRLQILLNAFQSPTNKLECLLQVLKVLDVPWNPTVLNIAVSAAASAKTDFTITDTDKIIAQEIYKELNYAKVKVILKKYNFPLTCTDYMLVIHKLLSGPSIDLNDLIIVTSILTPYKNYANIFYVDRCLQNSDTKEALDYYQSLPIKDRKMLLTAVVRKYEEIMNRASSDITVERNYLDFLKRSQSLSDTQITIIENLYYLKKYYDITLSLNDMFNENNSMDEINTWKQNNESNDSSGKGRCVTRLLYKDTSNHTSLLHKTYTSNKVRKIVEQLITLLPGNNNVKIVLSHFQDGQNSSLLLESCSILSDLVARCNEENLHYLIQYLTQLNSLKNADIALKNLAVAWKFQYIYLPISSVKSLNDLIRFCVDLNIDIEDDLEGFVNRSDFIPLRLVGNMAVESIKTGRPLIKTFIKIREKISRKLLTKVVASINLDHVFVTSLLLNMCSSDSIDDKLWILETLRGQTESLPPNVMYYISSPIIRHTFAFDDILSGNSLSYPPQYILKSKFNINLTEIALPDSTEGTWDVKVLLFYILRHYPQTPFDRLVDLCRTFNISVNDGLSLQLISLLSNWELKYKINEDDLGHRQIRYEKKEHVLMNGCLAIWESIHDKKFVIDIFNDFWKNGEVFFYGCSVSINPYYYEVYLCIYNLIFSTDSKNIKDYLLLHFLKEYRRKSIPKQYEYEMFSVKGMFPEIGHYRLPFHLFMREDMWSNLKSEITLETYERWLPIVPLLSLDGDLQTGRDMICSNAVKQTMTSRKQHENDNVDTKENEPWQLISKEEPLLRTAHKCVRHIANMEWAGACLFYVIQGCARGADQVTAAQLCHQFYQKRAALQPGSRGVRQMERLHSTLSTRHALHKVEWACEEFLKLTTEPAQLINALYLHPMFVEKIARHDINRTANEIADKNGINISSIRIQILENILNKTHKENQSNPGLNVNDLITAKYILKATCHKMGAIYLSRIAFDDESDFNKTKKLRALQCLMSVVESETAMKVTNRERDVLWTSLLELLFIVNLERIDIPWIVNTLMQDKILALKQLIQAAGCNIEGLKVAAGIAYRYGDIKTIRELIPLLLRAGLYEEMVPLLLKILGPPDVHTCSAWRAVILSPFQRADYPISERQRAKCLNSLNLLPVCPIIKDEDLLQIWKNCVRCKCFGLGCLVLPYMTSEIRQTLTELQKIDRRNLIASLKNLQSETYLVSGAMYVLEHLVPKTFR